MKNYQRGGDVKMIRPDICKINKEGDGSTSNLMQSRGFPELEKLYKTKYNYNTGELDFTKESKEKVSRQESVQCF